MILCLEGELEYEPLHLDERDEEAVLDPPLEAVDVNNLGKVATFVSLKKYVFKQGNPGKKVIIRHSSLYLE